MINCISTQFFATVWKEDKEHSIIHTTSKKFYAPCAWLYYHKKNVSETTITRVWMTLKNINMFALEDEYELHTSNALDMQNLIQYNGLRLWSKRLHQHMLIPLERTIFLNIISESIDINCFQSTLIAIDAYFPKNDTEPFFCENQLCFIMDLRLGIGFQKRLF